MTPSLAVPWSVRSVVFDLDGLLIDTEPIFEEAARRLLARRDKVLIVEVMRQIMGTPAREALPLFRERHALRESPEELGREWWDDFFAVVGERPVALLPGARDLVERLERIGVPRGIATSSTAAYVQKVLEPHRLLPHFDFLLSAEDVKQGKPHPEIYTNAAARFGHAPDEMLVLEDSVNGLRSAKAAGARCIVVPHPLVDVSALTAADAIVPRLDAPLLLKLLQLE